MDGRRVSVGAFRLPWPGVSDGGGPIRRPGRQGHGAASAPARPLGKLGLSRVRGLWQGLLERNGGHHVKTKLKWKAKMMQAPMGIPCLGVQGKLWEQ